MAPTEGPRARTPFRLAQLFLLARRADFWLGAACTLVIAFSALQIGLFSFGRDQSIYAEVADGLLKGQIPYLDRWDFKPPGIFFLHALGQIVFGKTMLASRLVEVLGLLAGAGLMVLISRRLFADGRPGLIAAAIMSWVHAQMEFWHSGQPETFGGFITLLGVFCAVAETRRHERQLALWLCCGMAFGFAFLLKPPLGGGLVACSIFIIRRVRFHDGDQKRVLIAALAMGCGAALPVLTCAAWFWTRGAWPALAWTLFEFTPNYTRLGWSGDAAGAFYQATLATFTRFSAVIAVGAFTAGIAAPVSSREREGLALILGVVALHVTGIALQAKFFEYHFGATLPLAALVAGLGWMKLWRLALRRGSGAVVALISLLLVAVMARRAVHDVPGTFWERSRMRLGYALGVGEITTREELDRRLYRAADFNLAANRDVAHRVAELAAPGAKIYVWGFEPSIYWLSEREPATRYIYNVPQRASWHRDQARADLLADLDRTPPELIIVQHHDYFRFVTGDDLDSQSALETFPELSELLESEYALVDNIEDFEIHMRNAPESP